MICRQCGTEIAEKALICYRCGTAVTEAIHKPVEPKKKTKRPVVVYVIFGVLVIAAIVMMLWR